MMLVTALVSFYCSYKLIQLTKEDLVRELDLLGTAIVFSGNGRII